MFKKSSYRRPLAWLVLLGLAGLLLARGALAQTETSEPAENTETPIPTFTPTLPFTETPIPTETSTPTESPSPTLMPTETPTVSPITFTPEPSLLPVTETPTFSATPSATPTFLDISPTPSLVSTLEISTQHPALIYTGVWTAYESTAAQGGLYTYSSGSSSDTVAFSFQGSRLGIGYIGHPTFGEFVVEIDGTVWLTVNTYAAETLFGNVASIENLPFGEHTVRIYSPAGKMIALDYFILENEPILLPTAEPTALTPTPISSVMPAGSLQGQVIIPFHMEVTLSLFGATGELVAEQSSFNGSFRFTDLLPDTYLLRLFCQGCLPIEGTFTIAADETVITPEVTVILGDMNGDGIITAQDIESFNIYGNLFYGAVNNAPISPLQILFYFSSQIGKTGTQSWE